MKKASVNGPNRRRNRVGDTTIAANPDHHRAAGSEDGCAPKQQCTFRIKPLEDYPVLRNLLKDRHAGFVSVRKKGGENTLFQQHQEMISRAKVKEEDNSHSDLPLLIHFHEMAVLVLTLLPIPDDFENDENQDIIYLSEVHRHNHKVCEDHDYPVTCCSQYHFTDNNSIPKQPLVSHCNQDENMMATIHDTNNMHGVKNIAAVHVEISVRNHHDPLLFNNNDNEDESDSDDENNENQPQRSRFTVDAKQITQHLFSSTYRCVLTLHELILVKYNSKVPDNNHTGGLELVCRIAEVHLTPGEHEIVEDNGENGTSNNSEPSPPFKPEQKHLSLAEATLDDPFRGRVNVHTEFFVSISDGSTSLLNLANHRPFPKGKMPSDIIHVSTKDGEWFPVRRMLLAPCLKLTRYVQAGRGKYKHRPTPTLSDEMRSPDAPVEDDGCPHCYVNIDCHTFDRVLIYLTSILFQFATPDEAAESPKHFMPDLSEINALTHAAQELGLQSLLDVCRTQLSNFDSRVRKDSYISLDEIHQRNLKGQELLLIVDGMVLDITRWIDEHPGGPSIIPTQALNVDATVFFEMYHVSRQAFVYLKSFYIGELRPEDYTKLQQQTQDQSIYGNKNNDNKKNDQGVRATEGFLESLRSFTKDWRVTISNTEATKIHKSL